MRFCNQLWNECIVVNCRSQISKFWLWWFCMCVHTPWRQINLCLSSMRKIQCWRDNSNFTICILCVSISCCRSTWYFSQPPAIGGDHTVHVHEWKCSKSCSLSITQVSFVVKYFLHLWLCKDLVLVYGVRLVVWSCGNLSDSRCHNSAQQTLSLLS